MGIFSKLFHKREPDRDSILEKYQQILTDNNLPAAGSTLFDFYHKPGRIAPKTILILGLGKGINGNVYALLKELHSKAEYADFRIYVRTSDKTEPEVNRICEREGWDRVTTVTDDKEYFRLLDTSEFLITETAFTRDWIKRPEQLLINLWHGTPLKTLGLLKPGVPTEGTNQKNFLDADYFLYPNDYTRQTMLDSYGVKPLMEGHNYIMSGYPRTAVLLQGSAEPAKKVYAYMPTWRDYLSIDNAIKRIEGLLGYLDSQLEEDEYFYIHLHHREDDLIRYEQYKHIKRFPEDMDTYTFLTSVDVLVTDYSSVMFDFAVTGRKIVLYTDDRAEYEQKHGFYTNIPDIPFDEVRSPEELLAALRTPKDYDDSEALEVFCKYDSAENANNICRLLTGRTQGLNIRTVPEDKREKVLVVTDFDMDEEKARKLRSYLKEHFTNSFVMLSGDKNNKTEANSEVLSLVSEYPVFRINRDIKLSTAAQSARKLCDRGVLTFDQAMEIVRFDAEPLMKRLYGNARFDKIIIHEVSDKWLRELLSKLKDAEVIGVMR